MLESVVLGTIQGIAEWLPISSEGLVVLAKVNFFDSALNLADLISYALFLHLGTFFAALLYFRKEIWNLSKSLFHYRRASSEVKKQINFYLLATVFSALVGAVFLYLLTLVEISLAGKGITLLVGIMLWFTAFFHIKRKEKGKRSFGDLKTGDGLLLGLVQGLSILPGLSRSGITVSALLLRKFEESKALKMSFIMSLPVVLGGNIILNYSRFSLSSENILAFLFSFAFGILTIHILLKVAKKLNFGVFVCLFGILVALSVIL